MFAHYYDYHYSICSNTATETRADGPDGTNYCNTINLCCIAKQFISRVLAHFGRSERIERLLHYTNKLHKMHRAIVLQRLTATTAAQILHTTAVLLTR